VLSTLPAGSRSKSCAKSWACAFLSPDSDTRKEAHRDVLALLFDIAVAARGHRSENVIAALANPVDGRRVVPEDIIFNCDNLLVGGVQTVRHTIAMSLYALARNLDAYRRFPQEGGRDLDRAVEELLRFTSVALHALRTACEDVVVEGHLIRQGTRVVVWLPAANRDEMAFSAPDALDLQRTHNPHLAFGYGPHYCIGARLARLEIKALLLRLRQQVREIDLVEPPRFNESIINFGPSAILLRLRR
jgi:cytochrome P450